MLPDKIYIPNKIDFVSAAILKTKNSPDDIEYVRKDILLEWTKTEKIKYSDETHPYVQFINVVIDKLNSI